MAIKISGTTVIDDSRVLTNLGSAITVAQGGTGATTAAAALTALGAYAATNPSGYTSNAGTVTSVGGTGTVSGLTLSGTVTGSGNLTLGGTLSLTSANVTTALGFTPYNATNPSGYITGSGSISGTSAGVVRTVTGTASAELVRGNMGDNDQARILVGATASNAGYLEIATADDGTEPIYVRQYTGQFITLTRTATLLNASGNTQFPGTVSAAGVTLTGNTGTVTSVGGTGTVSGLTLSGTVTGSGNLTLGGTLSTSIDNITDEHRLFNNMGDVHAARTSFDATAPSYNFGWRYVQGSTNGPGTGGGPLGQFYSLYTGLGNEYPATGTGSYGMYIAIDRDSTTPYLSVRYNEANVLRPWRRINAGGADTWTTARTLTVGNTGKSVNGSANVAWTLAEIGAGDVTLTGTQTLTNKTLNSVILNDGYTEEVFTVTGTAPALSPNNGSIQTWTLTANSTPTSGTWATGQSITLMVDDGTARTITWTSLPVTWTTNNGSAPTLNTTGFTAIALWKVGTTIYGARVGNA